MHRRSIFRAFVWTVAAAGLLAAGTASAAGIKAKFKDKTGVLTIKGDDGTDVVEVSRDAAGLILVNGGDVPIRGGGEATVASTVLIVVEAGGGNDEVTLNEANGPLPAAEIHGGAGNDLLIGGAGPDALFGDDGNDLLRGGESADRIFGGTGNDTLLGDRGNDEVDGEDGADLLIWNNGDGSDLLEGGNDVDTVQVNGADGAGDDLSIDPAGGRVSLRRNNLGLFVLDIGTTENLDVNGQGGSDVIIAAVGLNGLIELDLDGGEGNDLLTGGDVLGGDDNDVMSGGNDNLNGGADTDFCDGGTGSDSAINCETVINVP
jgi:Ca2+-binding RTX toxin-like protein